MCGHKFVDYSEFGYGVALLNDCKYGFSVKDDVMRMSIIRAPKSPDDKCDIGKHTFKYALVPHKGMFNESEVVNAGFAYNVPVEIHSCGPSKALKSLFTLNKKNLILDAVKMSEDCSGFIVVRLYEAYGGRCDVSLLSGYKISEAFVSNILEEKVKELKVLDNNSVSLSFTPFQVVTILCKLEK